ncbi:MAG: hypothetical protein DHS20C13_04930 [Thermodesulfobacteriota bacterium]|nr:MAG: hypothetical protein DHS20C13_04930 [Thermodesulfobacteriota bacterium]
MTKLDNKNLDITQKIGQVVMPRIDFNDPESLVTARRLVEECAVGGFIIFNGTRDIVSKTTQELQEISKIPLLFGCDAERGLGQVVSDMTIFPFTMSLGAANNLDLVYNQSSFIAQEMRECGLNLIFAPIADVNSNPDNPIINIRSYGDEPGLVSRLCSAFIKGCQDNGILACAKHFPGHGRTGVDSHVDLPVQDTSLETLQCSDLIPFEKSIEAGVATIMTAHIAFPQIRDGNAVTISKGLVSDVLRDEMGFQGLVITDSLHMEGIIKLGDEQYLSQMALNAGCDIILDPRDPFTLIQNLCNTELDLCQLNQKVERIFSAKQKLIANTNSSDSNLKDRGIKLRKQIAIDSVCQIKGEALTSKKVCVFVLDVTDSEIVISKPFTDYLEQNAISLNKISISTGSDQNFITDDIPEDSAVISLVYTTIGAWKKQSYLPDNFKEILKKLESVSHGTALVSFGSPYITRDFNKFKSIICSFDILDVCQVAAADVLLGKLPAKGKLPVDIS